MYLVTRVLAGGSARFAEDPARAFLPFWTKYDVTAGGGIMR